MTAATLSTGTGRLSSGSDSSSSVLAVAADTGPLNYLVLIDQAGILPTLFGRVLVAQAVADELRHPGAPAAAKAWMAAPPAWLSFHPDNSGLDADLGRLGAGERETILLATGVRADLILMDDRAGVRAARNRGLTVVGTLGLIERAAHLGLLDLEDAAARLQATNFRCHPRLLRDLLDRHRKA